VYCSLGCNDMLVCFCLFLFTGCGGGVGIDWVLPFLTPATKNVFVQWFCRCLNHSSFIYGGSPIMILVGYNRPAV